MLKEAIDKILSMAKPEIITVGGLEYSSKELHLVTTPRPSSLKVRSLTALVEYLKTDRDSIVNSPESETGEVPGLMIHVVDHLNVLVIESLDGEFKTRNVYIHASASPVEFRYGQYQDQESFMIELMTKFTPSSTDRARIMQIVGNLRSEHLATLTDDGVTQIASTRKGISLAQETMIPNPVMLRPYRTFMEIEQPESPFAFRLRDAKDGNPPSMALFEADGGKWKMDATILICDWLKEQLPNFVVLA